uniref:Integrase catalytic domain-containing protein n=1 Tax=Cyprinus carpio carpio TaxID=630221 RepID=A0A9J7X6G8_CYPCA
MSHLSIYGELNQVIPPAPLMPIPALGEPFERVIVDCVGPLPKTKSGNQFVLTIMCSATHYPEAIPLRTITAKAVIKSLIKFFSTFGLPKFVQTDQGTNFLSKLFKQVLSSLNIKHRVSSPYHPKSQGALERFHQTMKSMLKKYCVEMGNEWDEGIPFILFAIRETVQESLRCCPADLFFGHSVRGPLKVLKEQMLGISCDLSPKVNVLDCVCRRERVQNACDLAKDFLSEAQSNMKKRFDKKTVLRSFSVGDRVLVLLPIPGSALSACFAGPYEIVGKKSETDYVIKTPDRKRQ